MILKEYQEEAIEKLKLELGSALKSDTNDICIFQAPTGSGKTITCANLLKTIVQEKISAKPLSFIWISVRSLHSQSKIKLEKIYEDSGILQCSYFDDLQENIIHENEIWFINWEKIHRINNSLIVRENETEKYLDKIIQNTKDEGRSIVLIIDESHYAAQSEHSQELISLIGPQVTLEVSATPTLKSDCSAFYKTSIENVRRDEMIKNEVLVNPKIDKESVDESSATELVIKQSIKKQKELKEMYRKERSNVNPLILVQLPDSQKGITDKKEEIMEEYAKYQKTVENGKLAIWLSEDKSPSLVNIEKNDNEVDVLLFKQAIAIGWDCPRAAILVIFRENKKLEFTIQVIGRIMRMPELKHYTSHPDLNYGYIFTNLEKIDLTKEYVKDYAKLYHLERNDDLYNSIALHSTYLKRQRERTRLSGKFSKLFAIAAEELLIKDKLDMNVEFITIPLIVDGVIQNIDKQTTISADDGFNFNISEIEIQRRFDLFVIDACRPFAPYDSGDRLKTALYNWLYENFDVEKLSANAQVKILSTKNVELFYNAIQLAKEKYSKDVIDNLDNVRDHVENEQWEVPKIQSQSSATETHYKKFIMNPTYVKFDSNTEKEFIGVLESPSNKVKWWYKNGKSEVKYFAVPYTDEFGLEWSFYVDFIIQFTDGTLGIFDTKSGQTAKDAKYKAEGLAKYIKKYNTHTRPLRGGIAIPTEYGWKYNDNEVYEYNPQDLSDWNVLKL